MRDTSDFNLDREQLRAWLDTLLVHFDQYSAALEALEEQSRTETQDRAA